MTNSKLQFKTQKDYNFKREFSAGCVVYKQLKANSSPASPRRSRGRAKPKAVFLLGKHSGYHKWALPKGLIEEGEKGYQAAVRETEEEMGVKARLVDKKPIHKEQYIFHADYKSQPQISNDKFLISNKMSNAKPKRRVKKYQESGGGKIKVFKTVSFYLAEYQSGDPKDHDWEMEDGGWFTYEKALELMAFKGEKEALQKAKEKLQEIKNQPLLF